MRVFLVSPKLPYPTRGGGDLRTWNIVQGLLRTATVGVFGIGSEPPRPAPRDGIASWRATSPAAARVHRRQPADTSWIGQDDWRPSDWLYDPAIASEVAESVEEFEPDLVVLESLLTAGYSEVARSAGVPLVLDAHNVESDLQHQLVSTERKAPAKLVRRHFAERTRRLEEAVLGQVDGVWVCSGRDRELMTELFPHAPSPVVVPNVVDTREYAAARAEREGGGGDGADGRIRIFYPAQFAYPPNLRAARFLAEQLAPALAREIETELVLVGGGLPEEPAWTGNGAAVTVTGPVADVRPFFAGATAMVVPLFEGSGTRLKILEAFACRLPVVSTRKGAEGLELVDRDTILLAESVEQFVAAVLEVGRTGLGAAVARSAWELVEERYSLDSVAEALRNALEPAPRTESV